MTAQLTVRTPSGRVVDVTAGTGEKVLDVNTSCLLTAGNSSRVFTTGGRGYHALACEAVVKASLVWRAYVAGHELLASATDDGEVLVTTLIGRHHELMTVWADGAVNRGHVERTFASLAIDDTAEGMVFGPGRDSFTSYAWEDVAVIVDNRGWLHIPDTRGAGRITPAWGGAKTQKGELWKRPKPDRESSASSIHDFVYTIGGPRGSAEVQVEEAASESELLAWLDVLEVAWR